MTSIMTSNDVPLSSYPRTGKRGVPQQFPRRLSEMLESESHLAKVDPKHQCIITWSDSGKAFRIVDVSLFSLYILPKYFRTSKFSSFQRNLNLYGFCKVRRGPDTDMYAHPSFIRGQPEKLAQLRKGAARKHFSDTAKPSKSVICIDTGIKSRAVSPSPTRMLCIGYPHIAPLPNDHVESSLSYNQSNFWSNQPFQSMTVSPVKCDSGKLGLLTLALISLAERDSLSPSSHSPIESI